MLTTPRLTLRKFTASPTDMAALYQLLADEAVNRFLPWFPLKNLAETKIFYQTRLAPLNEKRTSFYWALCRRGTDTPIGYLHLSDDASHDLGYGLAQNYWGQGLMTEAVQAVVDYLRVQKIVPFITATHDVKNTGSGRVMQNAGLTYRYSYEELWQPKNKAVTFRLYQLDLQPDTPTYTKYWQQSALHFVEKITTLPLT